MARDAMDDSASKDHTYIMEEIPTEKASLAGLPDHLHQANWKDCRLLSLSVDKAEQKKIFHKVDWRLCPMLAILYLISHLDRANIGLETLSVLKQAYQAPANLSTKETPRLKASRKL